VLGLGLAAMTAVTWGALPVALKVLVQWVDVYTLAWARYATGVAMLTPLLIRREGWGALSAVRKGPLLTGVCVVGLCGNFLTYLTSLRTVSPGAAQVVIQLSPMLVLLGGLLIFREGFSRTQWLGFGMLVVGIGLFFHPQYDALVSDASTYTWGVLLLVIAAALWAAYILAQKQLQMHMSPEAVLLVIYVSGVVLLWPVGEPSRLADLEWPQLGVLGAASVAAILSYVCFGKALNHVEASRTGVLVAATPLITFGIVALVAPVVPHLLQPEPLSAVGWVGAGMVVVGSVLGASGNELVRVLEEHPE